MRYILWFKNIRARDVALVGGKNANLGEMYSKLISKGVNVPNGFAISSEAYWHFLRANQIDKKLKEILSGLNARNLDDLNAAGMKARRLILDAKFPPDLEKNITDDYHRLELQYGENCDVAVRSSATAEDLAGAISQRERLR